ncbi:Hypothetical_protein [Hexamita inflata]|uniref:Hypothetical_protein n=1 Tax=Hexamita inflata TaxID=28002 RepID=A0AA86P3C7_9EUKA|nr:Hypothetical protein HINF_LOCUS17770 [Hexamita inflata]
MHFRTRLHPVAHRRFPQIVSNVSSAGVSNMLVEHRGILQKFFISSFGSVWYSDIDTGSLWKNVMWIGSWFSDWPIWEWTIILYRWNRVGWKDENTFQNITLEIQIKSNQFEWFYFVVNRLQVIQLEKFNGRIQIIYHHLLDVFVVNRTLITLVQNLE